MENINKYQNEINTVEVGSNERIRLPKYTIGEEITNVVTHGLGVVLGVVALVLSIVKTASPFRANAFISCLVFSLSLILMYSISSVYHMLKRGKGKKVLRVIDHCSIFVLIAGTYTPFTLVALGSLFIGKLIFAIIWTCAIVGVALNAIDLKRYSIISCICYILMGWMIVLAFKPLARSIDPTSIALLIWGGVVYTIGAVLYAIGSKCKYFHSVFHGFCVVGSFLHFLSILLFIA